VEEQEEKAMVEIAFNLRVANELTKRGRFVSPQVCVASGCATIWNLL
jgi:hypothetical protein